MITTANQIPGLLLAGMPRRANLTITPTTTTQRAVWLQISLQSQHVRTRSKGILSFYFVQPWSPGHDELPIPTPVPPPIPTPGNPPRACCYQAATWCSTVTTTTRNQLTGRHSLQLPWLPLLCQGRPGIRARLALTPAV